MVVRTFTAPSPYLNSALAGGKAMDHRRQPNGVSDQGRSLEGASHTAMSQPADARDPLAHHHQETKPGITFAAQDQLPKLPIPDLDATCKRYLEALEPLQSYREHQDTERAVREFQKHEGSELQQKLHEYSAGRSSYIEQFWYDSYLNFDNPVVLNLNPFFLLEDDPTPARNNQVTRAASLVISALCFVRAVRKEELPPDMVRKQPLCMYQYSRMFGTARIPTENGCQIAQDSFAKHIVVLVRGQFYWFDTLDDNNDLIMTEHDVAKNLEAIVHDAQKTPIQEAAKGAIGVLSTENRKVWSGLRDVISREEGSNNAECLNIVDSSLFIVCLDHMEPADSSQLSMNMLCGTSEVDRGVQVGTCTNRWYDKMQIIVCKNGSAGINFEHTGVDGHTVLRFASDVYTDTILRFAKSINGQAPSLWATTSPDPAKRDPDSFGNVSLTPHKLEWDMIPELMTALRFAETRLADLIQQNEFRTLEFGTYGKNFITSMGFSPDAFVQMAFQAAYYGLYGRMECVYEPAMTKIFYHGRTEAIRAVTKESSEFVRTFWAENPAHRKIEALRRAAQKHVDITKQCSQAQGQDRHLYALYCVWQRSLASPDADVRSLSNSSIDGETPSITSEQSRERDHSAPPPPPMPTIFADAGYDKLNNTVLSTSNCGNPSLRHFGFGPTSGDGFGIGYIVKDSGIFICASSKHRQTKRFVEAIEAYFLEIRKLLKTSQRRGTSADKQASRAREAEEKNEKNRAKSRGKAVQVGGVKPGEPKEESMSDGEDDGLGGYGFFDAGMLAKTLEDRESRGLGGSESSRNVHVGRKVRLLDA
ncbi:MAG: hypothetical protein Q9162_001334 [Coniocarpon cinnabarinum]